MKNTSEIPWKRITVEAVAIVASILLAFAIDAWWQDRNEVELERRLVTALLAEFEQNSELLRQEKIHYEQRYMDALRILEYLQQGTTSSDHAELEELFRGFLIAGTLHLESGAHDGLLGSGELSLIRDEELRNRLAAWPSYVNEWSEERDAVFSYVHSNVYPYLSDSVRIRNIATSWLPFPDGESPPLVPAGASDIRTIVEIISASFDFDNLVYLRAQGLWYAMRDLETLLAQATAIEELLGQNLEK